MATISEIATRLGLSKSTVSRALRELPNVSPETIEAVRATALEMGYVPSVAAAGLATGRNHAVGVVVPSLHRWFYASVVSGINRVLAESGYDTVLYDLDRSHLGGTRKFVRSLLRRRVDGLIAISTHFGSEEIAEFQLLEIPMIAVGPRAPGFRTIGVNDAALVKVAAEHLLELGHTKLGFVGGYDAESRNIVGASEREHAFLRATLEAEAFVEPAWIVSGGYREDLAWEAVTKLYQGDDWPTALLCASDDMAIGAINALRSLGLKVPEDVSVIGIDGHEHAAVYNLTTCSQDAQGQGAFAAREIVKEIEGAPRSESFDSAEFELIVRGTTAAPRESA